MRNMISILVATVVLSLSAHAVTFASDATDLWYNNDESGWGANVIQQDDILFITFFVYDASGRPTWYVGSEVSYASTQGGALVYSGKLFQASGPWFGGPFSAQPVALREVGTVTFTLSSLTSATIAYVADGVSFSKSVVRQTWAANNLTGGYLAGTAGTWSACATGNGYEEEPGILTISHNLSSLRMVMTQSSSTCTFTGTYAQNGRLGSATGTVSCTNGSNGTFTASEIEGGVNAISGRALVQYGSCRWLGRLGGLRRGQ